MRRFLFLLFFPLSAFGQNNFPPLGQWREHLPYQVAIDVTASDTKIFAATPLSLFSVEVKTGEVERFSKVSGLSETGISTIQYDALSKKLYVAYTNSNIDVLTANSIRNIPDLKRSAVTGNKNIYQIYPDVARCYLSTGLGVIVLDADKYEIREWWALGAGGGYVKTNGFTRSQPFFYAATDEGLKRTPVTTPNPADFRSWQVVSGTNGLQPGIARNVVTFRNKTVVLQNDSLFVEEGINWRPFFANGVPVVSMQVSNNQLLLSQQAGGFSQVVVLNEAGAVQRIIQNQPALPAPQKAIAMGTDYWIADKAQSLVRVAGNSFENYKLNSPQNIVLGDLAVRNGALWATAGTVNSSWNYQYNPSGAFRLKNGQWSAYNLYAYPQLDSVLDLVTIAIDPRDNSAWAGSFGGGLIHFDPTAAPKIFKQSSPIGATPGDPNSYRVAGLAFDAENNLWISNFGSPQPLHVLKSDATWQSFSAPFTLHQNAMAQILIDDAGNKWIQGPLGNGLLVFDEGSFANPADDRWRLLKAGAGAGNLPSNEVLCLAKDKDGFIWVGTGNGIAVFQCPQDIFSTGCEAVLPVVKEGSFASVLFRGQEVRSIAVDGANRKWVGTGSGVWLVSADGDKVLQNFTETNSPLLSNDVKRVALDGSTGEVFIATAKGLISFRSDATEADETKSAVLVFPNPVPPGYSGTIGIRGLPENSIVKITEPNGRLVFQTRSLGGQAVWNGRDYRGNKAATGVYLVMAVDHIKGEQMVGKIVLVK